MYVIIQKCGLRKNLVVLVPSEVNGDNLVFETVATECPYDYGKTAVIESLNTGLQHISSYGITALAIFNAGQILSAYRKAEELAKKVTPSNERLKRVLTVCKIESVVSNGLILTEVSPKDLPSSKSYIKEYRPPAVGSMAAARRAMGR